MRVLYLTNNPNTNSTARILQYWVKFAQQEDISPVVVAQHEGTLSQWMRDENIDCLVDPMPWPNRRRPFELAYHVARVGMWALKRGVRLIHCNEHNVYPFAYVLARLINVPIVCHVRFRLPEGFAAWAFGGRRAPSALLWTSDQQRKDCEKAVGSIVPAEHQHLVPLGIDTTQFGLDVDTGRAFRQSHNIPDDAIVIGTASALRRIKRIHEVVKIIHRIAQHNPNVVGLIAGDAMPGDENYRDWLQKKVAATRLGDRLRLIGHVDDIEPFMQSLDVFVSASEYETFGNSVLEAMACSKPVAAYAGGSVAEVVGNAGLIAPTDDFDALQQHVQKLVNHGVIREHYAPLARNRVAQHFSPQASFSKVLDIYRALHERRIAA